MEKSLVLNVLRGGAVAVFSFLIMGSMGAVAFAQVAPPTAPTVTLSPIADQTVNAGQVVTFIAIAIDSDPAGVITYFYAASTTASNTATIDPLSGAFSWDTTGVTPGVYSFNVQAAGSTGGYDIKNVFITVTDPPPAPPAPTNKDQCKNGGWKTFTNLHFKNQGQCVSYVQANEKAAEKRFRNDVETKDISNDSNSESSKNPLNSKK